MNLCILNVGQVGNLRPIGNRHGPIYDSGAKPITYRLQVTNLPHSPSRMSI
jgi:hypothetical protein